MTHTELWLTYHLASRADRPSTAQLVELEFQNHKISDLEDVLEYVFRQGYVEAKHRPVTWWEQKDGKKVKSSQSVEELLKQGVGKCQESALKLVIEDIPPALWFSYVYLHNQTGHVVTQRIKFDCPQTKFERLAHVTNYIFKQGYLPAKLRSVVHWQHTCGKRVEECEHVENLLSCGEGISEDKPLRLIIDNASHYPVARCCH